jgi:hypothetical protein
MGPFRSRKIVFAGLYAALASFGTFTFAAQMTVTLAWDPSVSKSVAGYRLYEGLASKTYTNVIDVGNSTTASISGLETGVTYFFAVAAYDAQGLEGALSAEITFTLPVPPSQLQVVGVQGGQTILSGTGQAGHTYDILVASAVSDWKVIGTVTVGPTGSFQFVDPTKSGAPVSRSYQLHEVTLPEPLPLLNIQNPAPGQITLSGTGLLGHSYDILATRDFGVWLALGSVTAGAGGAFSFVVPATKSVRSQFFRLHETTYTLPGTLPKLGIRIAPGRQVLLDVTGQIGHAYVVAVTQDFVSWSQLSVGVVGASGQLQFSDPIRTTAPARFYRVGEVLP